MFSSRHRISALIGSAVLLASGCSGGSPGAEEDAAKEPKAIDPAVMQEPSSPVMFGKARSITACRLLPIEEIERTWGGMLKPTAWFSQQYDLRSLPDPEKVEVYDRRSQCSYYLGADGTKTGFIVELSTTQFSDPAAVDEELAFIREQGSGEWYAALERGAKDQPGSGALAGAQHKMTEALRQMLPGALASAKTNGGTPVPGMGEGVLYQPLTHNGATFAFRAGDVLVALRPVSTIDIALKPRPLSRDEIRQLTPGIRDAIALIRRNATDPDLPQAPIAPVWPDTKAWTSFMDACALLDSSVMKAVRGSADPGAVTDATSIALDPVVVAERTELAPVTRAAKGDCDRFLAGAGSSVKLEVYHPAPGTSVEAVLPSAIVRYHLGKSQSEATLDLLLHHDAVKRLDVEDADEAVLAEGKKHLWLTVDGVVLHLGVHDKTSEEAFVAAGALLAAKVRASRSLAD